MLHFSLKFLVGLLFLVFGFNCSASAVPLISFIKTADHINKTRLVIDFNQQAKFQYLSFSRPHQIVIDFLEKYFFIGIIHTVINFIYIVGIWTKANSTI